MFRPSTNGSQPAPPSSLSFYSFMAGSLNMNRQLLHTRMITTGRDKDYAWLNSELSLSSILPPNTNLPSENGENIFDTLFANRSLSDCDRASLINVLFQRGYNQFYKILMGEPYITHMLKSQVYGQLMYTMYSWLLEENSSQLVSDHEQEIWFALIKTENAARVFAHMVSAKTVEPITLKEFVAQWMETLLTIHQVRTAYQGISRSVENTRFSGVTADFYKYAKQRVVEIGLEDNEALQDEETQQFLKQHRFSFLQGGWGETKSSYITRLAQLGEVEKAAHQYKAECDGLKNQLLRERFHLK